MSYRMFPRPDFNVEHMSVEQVLEMVYNYTCECAPLLPEDYRKDSGWDAMHVHLTECVHGGPDYKLTTQQLANLKRSTK